MKLMVQADDYGMTVGVTDGIIACARDGVLTQTGLFTNMPSTEYAVNRMKDYPHILLGQDLNLSTGRPVTDPKLIPTLVNEDGSFLTSRQHRVRDAENPANVSYDDAYLEYDNQVKRFIELVGRLPGYIAGHAWHSGETERALNDIAEKYGVFNVRNAAEVESARIASYWCSPVVREDKSYDYSVNVQLEKDPVKMLINKQLTFLEEHYNEDIVVNIHTHAGFMDRDLVLLSSFTAVRPMEAGLICSPELKQWIKDHNVELVNYLDIYK